MIPACPLTGQPCMAYKSCKITEISHNKDILCFDLCHNCIKTFLYKDTPVYMFDKIKKPSIPPDPIEITVKWLKNARWLSSLKQSWRQFIGEVGSFFKSSTLPEVTSQPKKIKSHKPFKPHIQIMPDKQMLKLTFPTGQVNTKDLIEFINTVNPEDFIKPNIPNVKCPKCGWTLTQLTENAKLGCPECYETFKEFIAPTIDKFHSGSQHIGKKPQVENQITSLEEKLKAAILNERYEDAVILRDQISIKKKELIDLRSKKSHEDN